VFRPLVRLAVPVAMLVVGYAAVSAAHEPAAATCSCDLVRDRDARPAGLVTERGQADCATAREVRLLLLERPL
jgi:hypothetical protein